MAAKIPAEVKRFKVRHQYPEDACEPPAKVDYVAASFDSREEAEHFIQEKSGARDQRLKAASERKWGLYFADFELLDRWVIDAS